MIRNYLPYYINKKLFGDRDRYGKKPNLNDSEWIYWRKNYLHFNNVLQKSFLPKFINSFNYKILENIDFKDKVIAELGGGIGDHNKYFNTYPKKYYCIDINKKYFSFFKKRFDKKTKLIFIPQKEDNYKINLPDNSCDIFITFFSLEHLHPIKKYLLEIKRILKPKGLLVGAIPTEGSIAWGLGRYVFTRNKYKGIDISKIYCWEHPNYCDDIIHNLNLNNFIGKIKTWPVNNFFKDFSISINFILKNKKSIDKLKKLS